MLLFSARSGAVAQRIGPRTPMTLGPLVVGIGVALFVRAQPGATYAAGVLPAVLVLGVGLVITVAPLTAAVLGAVDDHHAGIGSAINNGIARIGSLLAVAVLPAAAGLTDARGDLHLTDGFGRAMVLTAGLAVLGGIVAFLTVRDAADVDTVTHGTTAAPCLDPCVKHGALDDVA